MHLMWWVEGSRLRCTANPISADSGEKASWAPFVVSTFAGINAECLLRALIYCCRAGKQASWKGATRCLLYARWTSRIGRGSTGGAAGVGGQACCGGNSPQASGGTTRCLPGCRKAPRTENDTGFPITFPSHPPPPTRSSATRRLIPEYLAAPSMATVALPPGTASASFLPAPSPCSPLWSPEPGLRRRLAHPTGRWLVHPRRRDKQAFASVVTKPQQEARRERMRPPNDQALSFPGTPDSRTLEP